MFYYNGVYWGLRHSKSHKEVGGVILFFVAKHLWHDQYHA